MGKILLQKIKDNIQKHESILSKIFIFLIYTFYGLHYFQFQINFQMISDDEVEAERALTESFTDMFMRRFNYNGRICTDVLANVFYRVPIEVWMLVVTFVWISIAWLIVNVFTSGDLLDVFVVCYCITLFPYHYLSSAGYIATSTNYLFTLYSVLVIIYIIKRRFDKGNIGIIHWFILILNMIYASNHDQSGVAVIAGLLILYLFLRINKGELDRDNNIIRFIIVNLVISIVLFVIMFALPGHVYRMTNGNEMTYWLPEFANWSFLYKVFKGYSSTIAVVLYNDLLITDVLCALLLLLGLTHKSWKLKLVSALPYLIINILPKVVNRSKVICYNKYGMFDLYDLDVKVWPFVLSIFIIFCVVVAVINSDIKNKNKWIIISLLIIGAGTREMMGFSATIYASSYRTFTILLFGLVIASVLIYSEVKRYTVEKGLVKKISVKIKDLILFVVKNSVIINMIKQKKIEAKVKLDIKLVFELVIVFLIIILICVCLVNIYVVLF